MNKAILLDPYATGNDFVKEVEYNDFRDIQRLIGCDCFTSFPLGMDTGFCDDNGLLTLTAMTRFVDFGEIYPQPIAGRVLVVGPADHNGDSLPPRETVEFYLQVASHISIRQAMLMA